MAHLAHRVARVLVVQAMCAGDGFDELMGRALQRRDELLLKVVRNFSLQDSAPIKRRLIPHMDNLVALLQVSGAPGCAGVGMSCAHD